MQRITRGGATAVAILALGALAPGVASAWGSNGHRIVAQIGQDHLSPEARAAVTRIAGGRSLALLATWPDFIRSEPAWDFAKPWHFVTVEDGEKLDAVLAEPADPARRSGTPRNVVEAIGFFADVLGDVGDARTRFAELLEEKRVRPYGSVEQTALTFLVHFIGDIHQPLHVGRGGDRGGNSIAVNWFDDIDKLHAVWDSGLIASEQLGFREFAEFLEQELGGEPVAAGTPSHWALESIDYRNQVYEIWQRTSRENYLPELGYDYAHDNIGLVKQRLYQGGRRVAHLLNEIYRRP